MKYKTSFPCWIYCSGDGGVPINSSLFKSGPMGLNLAVFWTEVPCAGQVTQLGILLTQEYKKIHPRD